jgi:hypothetical protein
VEGNGHPNLGYYPGICLEGLRKTMKTSVSMCPGRELNMTQALMFWPPDKCVAKEDVCRELGDTRKRFITLAVMTLFMLTGWYLLGK